MNCLCCFKKPSSINGTIVDIYDNGYKAVIIIKADKKYQCELHHSTPLSYTSTISVLHIGMSVVGNIIDIDKQIYKILLYYRDDITLLCANSLIYDIDKKININHSF